MTTYITTEKAAKLLGVSKSTVRRAVYAGVLENWHTPGGHYRYSTFDVLEFAEIRMYQKQRKLGILHVV